MGARSRAIDDDVTRAQDGPADGVHGLAWNVIGLF
jgi:hypothetical protein